MLKYTDRWSLVALLVNTMRDNGGWAGETHIQKSLFFLQNMLNVPTAYEFVLYKHGPYSFELHDDLGRMRAQLLLGIEPHPPYGSSFELGPAGNIVLQREHPEINGYVPHLNFIVEKLGRKDVRSLERLATALFVQDRIPNLGENVIANTVVNLKPHIKESEALEALRSISEIKREAKERRLVLKM